MFKTLWDDTTWQRLINYISNYRSNLIQTIVKNRGRDRVKVTRLFWHFLEHFFHAVIRYKLKFCKGSPRELSSVTGEWSIGVKAASNQFNLTNKKFTKLIRKRLWGNVWGQDSTSECAHQLIAKTEKLPWTITVYNFFTNIVFLDPQCKG